MVHQCGLPLHRRRAHTCAPSRPFYRRGAVVVPVMRPPASRKVVCPLLLRVAVPVVRPPASRKVVWLPLVVAVPVVRPPASRNVDCCAHAGATASTSKAPTSMTSSFIAVTPMGWLISAAFPGAEYVAEWRRFGDLPRPRTLKGITASRLPGRGLAHQCSILSAQRAAHRRFAYWPSLFSQCCPAVGLLTPNRQHISGVHSFR